MSNEKDPRIVATVFMVATESNLNRLLESKTKKALGVLHENRFAKTTFALCGSPPNCENAKGIISIISKNNQCRLVKELKPISVEAWKLLYQRNQSLMGADMQTLHNSEAGGPLLVCEGGHLFSCIKEIAKVMRYGEQALLASNGILITAALATALNYWDIKVNLRPGEIIAFHFQFGNKNTIEFYNWEYIELPKV